MSHSIYRQPELPKQNQNCWGHFPSSFFVRPRNHLLFIYFKPWFLWFLLCIYFCIPQSSWLLQVVCVMYVRPFSLLTFGTWNMCVFSSNSKTIGVVLKIDYHFIFYKLPLLILIVSTMWQIRDRREPYLHWRHIYCEGRPKSFFLIRGHYFMKHYLRGPYVKDQ